jgi:thymidylate kinase
MNAQKLEFPNESAQPATATASELPQVDGLIAVVGCDGTGKSTLTHDLVKAMSREGPTVRRYLGLVSGESGAQIRRLPLIGPRLERRLAAKAAHAQDMSNRPPGVLGSLVMFGFSLWRVRNLRRVVRLARRGVLVITDRYPQAEVDGFRYDGPGLGRERSTNAIVRWLAAREIRLYDRMAAYRPALVIKLGIDVATAHARKPDHAWSELTDKIAVVERLRFNGARIVVLDARAPYAEVLKNAIQAVSTARVSHFAAAAP